MKAIALFLLLASSSVVEAIRQAQAPKSKIEISLTQTPYTYERDSFVASELDYD